jgi:hypothetical protein
MSQKNTLCPFKFEECTPECALYIDPADLNEVVRNKLASVGVLNREKGMCSFKNISMCMSRQVYEQLATFLR